MSCPRCKSEYVKGITSCRDCELDLRDELPAEKAESQADPINDDLVEIYMASSEADAELVRGLLETSGIPVVLNRPFARGVHVFSGIGSAAVMVLVFERDFEVAYEVIESAVSDPGGLNARADEPNDE